MGVVECPDWELELVGVSDESLQIRDCVTVSVDVDLTTKYGRETFSLEVLGQVALHVRGLNLISS